MNDENHSTPPLIYKRLAAVFADTATIAKDSLNKQQNFNYRSIDQLYDALHPVCAKHGIFILPRVTSHKREEKPTAKGSVQFFHTVECEFSFVAEDGSSATCATVGHAADSGDKGASKAMTAALKGALVQTLLIPVGEDADADASTPEETAARARAFAPPPTPSPRPVRPPQPPAAADYEGDVELEGWRGHKIHFGNSRGIALGALPKASLYGWIEKWTPNPQYENEDDRALRAALDAAREELYESWPGKEQKEEAGQTELGSPGPAKEPEEEDDIPF